jgi:membrane protease YdiL (CAAX protease family)
MAGFDSQQSAPLNSDRDPMLEPLSQNASNLPPFTKVPLDEQAALESPVPLSTTNDELDLDGHTPDRPNLAHTALFLALALFILFVGELITVGIARKLPVFRQESFTELASDPLLMIPSQAIQYAALLAATAAIFRAIWGMPFWRTIHWNYSAVRHRWVALAGIGLLLGVGTSVAGNYLPMPKEAPILNDLMHSTTGAWLMFVFGTTGAPVVEELAFRGFLLPSLINAFRWLNRSRLPWQGTDSRPAVPSPLPAGVAASILLTSLPFALLHSLQVSYAWAPVLLIGVVSIALCIIRLWTNSLAASTFVHSVYNFSLFTGMLIASDGFRHLEKLNN